jgi:hypothetical protein
MEAIKTSWNARTMKRYSRRGNGEGLEEERLVNLNKDN